MRRGELNLAQGHTACKIIQDQSSLPHQLWGSSRIKSWVSQTGSVSKPGSTIYHSRVTLGKPLTSLSLGFLPYKMGKRMAPCRLAVQIRGGHCSHLATNNSSVISGHQQPPVSSNWAHIVDLRSALDHTTGQGLSVPQKDMERPFTDSSKQGLLRSWAFSSLWWGEMSGLCHGGIQKART